MDFSLSLFFFFLISSATACDRCVHQTNKVAYFSKTSALSSMENKTMGQAIELIDPNKLLTRGDFPPGFMFGTSSSAYQYEGGWKKRGLTIWDTFTHLYPEKIVDGSNGDSANEFHIKYPEDVRIMHQMGHDFFILSFSWARIFPTGRLSGGVDKEGVQFYHNLIEELKDKGIEPFVTLFHWNTPQALEDEYKGFLDRRIVYDFRDFADFCFKTFGDQVKNWITFNEPWTFCIQGYSTGDFAPGRCSPMPQLIRDQFAIHRSASTKSSTCGEGDSATEPYIVGHHLLLAHARAVEVYRQKYQARQQGKIGIANLATWFVPYTETAEDRAAALRALDFMLGWFTEPLAYGHYPLTMRALVRKRLPEFNEEESMLIKGSYDFMGLHYYTARYAQDIPHNLKDEAQPDSHVIVTAYNKDGVPIGPTGASSWLYIYPRGIYDLVTYTKNRYGDPLIYLLENGVDGKKDDTSGMDTQRINYHYDHLSWLRVAIREGVNVKAYSAWSLLDNFEWAEGYTVRFGINLVHFDDTTMRRSPNLSKFWFQHLMKK